MTNRNVLKASAHAAMMSLLLLASLAIAAPAYAQDASSSAASSAPASAEPAATPDPAQVAAGKKVWEDGGCANCHGARGQGGTSVDFPKGPSLRTSGLDRDTMILIVTCGIPGTRMPAWLKGAYTETECNGLPVGTPPSGTIVTGAYTAEQIEALVDYIQATFVQPAQ